MFLTIFLTIFLTLLQSQIININININGFEDKQMIIRYRICRHMKECGY